MSTLYYFFIYYSPSNGGVYVLERERERESRSGVVMAASLVFSMSLKPSPIIEKSGIKPPPPLARPPFSLRVQARTEKKIKTATPYGL